MPFLHVTTRIDGREHDDLLSDKADRVLFPTVIYMDAEGEPLTVLPDSHTVAKYEAVLERVQLYLVLRGKRDAGDQSVATDLSILECELGRMDYDELEAELEEAELTPAQQARVAQLRVNAAVRVQFLIAQKQRHSPESVAAATDEFLALLKDGPEPDLGGDEEKHFWHLLWQHGSKARDAALMERVLAGIRKLLAEGGEDRAELLAGMEKEIAAVREAK